MDTKHRTLTLTPMLTRSTKQTRALSLQKPYKAVPQKIEQVETSEVFTYTPEKASSKEKIKYVVSRTVNRNMLVAIDLLKELKSNNSISNISDADLEMLIIKPFDRFIDGRVVRKQQERANPFDTPRDVTEPFTKLLSMLKHRDMDLSSIRVDGNQSSLSSASKLLRMYISNNLERNGRQIVLDAFLKSLFPRKQIQDLYDKNGGSFITQGQIQKLASLLVIKSL